MDGVGVVTQAALDLAGGNVLAAADDHVVRAAHEVVISVFVLGADVAGLQPAVGGELLPVVLGAVVIALHDAEALDLYLAHFIVVRRPLRLLVPDAHFHALQGLADAVHGDLHGVAVHGHADDGGALRLAVHGQVIFQPEHAAHLRELLGGNGRAAHGAGHEGAEVVLRAVGVILHNEEHGGHGVENRAAVLFNGGHDHAGGEVAEDDRGHLVAHADHHAAGQTRTVEHGHGQRHDVALAPVHPQRHGAGVIEDAVMAQQHALGLGGGAGGEDDGGGVLTVRFLLQGAQQRLLLRRNGGLGGLRQLLLHEPDRLQSLQLRTDGVHGLAVVQIRL